MLELCSLVRRDHDDLHYALRVMCESTDENELARMRDRVCRQFPAHAEAESIALGAMLERTRPSPKVYFLVSQVIASHLSQETALAELARQRIGSHSFRERARYLRQLVVYHADHEHACMHPVLPEHMPREIYRTLGTCYAIERDRILEAHRKLACLEPDIARSA
jgi:hypothetical protein